MRYKAPEMADTLVRRPVNAGGISQGHRDVTDDRYRDLRKPRKVKFFCNGDRYFKGKKLFVTPHRYLTFNDLLNDLTGKLPATVQLPYGVRQIYTPVGGRKIRDIEELQDGKHYVCGGFEIFKPIPYGRESLEPWTLGKQNGVHGPEMFAPPSYGGNFGNTGPYNRGYYNAFQPGRSLRNYPRKGYGGYGNRPAYGAGAMWNPNQQSEASLKPKVVTVIRNGSKPRSNVKILLNRRSVQSFEQLVKDISEAFGAKWKNNKVRKLFSIRGREIQGVSDFFRDDDVFIGIGNDSLTTGDVQEILDELYPDSSYSKNLMKDWEKTKKKNQHAYQSRLRVEEGGAKDGEKSKIDSGLGSDESARDEAESETASKTKEKEKKKKKRIEEQQPQQEETTQRLERERVRYAEIERERARKRLQKRMESDRRILEDERRKKGLVPLKPVQDPFKKIQEEKDQEKREEQTRQQREAEERNEKEHQRDLAQAEARARDRARKAQEEESVPKVIVVVKGDTEKMKKFDDAETRSQKSPVRKSDKAKLKEKKDRENEEKKDKEIKDEKGKEPKVGKPKAPKEDQKRLKEEEKPPKDEEKTVEADTKSIKDTVSETASKTEPQNEPAKPNPPPKEKTLEKVEAPKTPIGTKDEKIKPDHEGEKKKRQKSKIVRKTKFERQISNVDYVLDKYEPGKTLGDGNFAIVKTCKLKNTSHEFAMKIVDKSKLRGKEHMIENEIAIMKQCNHPRIVKLMEEYETKTEIYLIMELVKGGDLFDAITQSVKFDEKTASGMCTDVVNALYYLHSRDIVHRDLKPENLLVLRNKDGSISLKLADFGLAMDVHQPIYTVCGTPTYVAPEILSEIGYGLEVDMWAVGVITYILLCGFPPFRSPDRNQTELFEFIKAGEYDFLSPYWDNISRAAKDLISRLLIVDRKKRYSAIDVLVHPWVITFAGSQHPPAPMDEHRRNLRSNLETQAKASKAEYVAQKTNINSERS